MSGPGLMISTFPTLDEAIAAFKATLATRPLNTSYPYGNAAERLGEFVRGRGSSRGTLATNQLSETILEEFYHWLQSVYGDGHRDTIITYLTGARAFARFLAAEGWLASPDSYERMTTGLSEVIGKRSYRAPRATDAAGRLLACSTV